jgi:hypothetical protein
MKKSEIKREVFSTRIDSALLKKVRYLAVDEKKPVNQLLEEAIELLLKKYKKSLK